MPARSSQTSQTFWRHVAPVAPLALALLMNAAPSSSPTASSSSLATEDIPDSATAVQCEENIADFRACHANYPTGCSKAAGYDAYLNYLKNLTPSPPSGGTTFLDQSGFDNLNSGTPDGLGHGNNHAEFKDQLTTLGEGAQRGVIGYLYYFQVTGAESSNCQLTGPDKNGGNVDFHIGIGFDKTLVSQVNVNSLANPPKALQQSSVIVEMTPHYRAQFQDGIWTIANLRSALGHKVRVVGQLLADSEHNKPTDNCALAETAAQKSHCWRYSVWELHPVTIFEYCKDDSCTQNSGDWIPLGTNSDGTAADVSGQDPDEMPSAVVGATRNPQHGSTLSPGR
jgi:hypothetical protein